MGFLILCVLAHRRNRAGVVLQAGRRQGLYQGQGSLGIILGMDDDTDKETAENGEIARGERGQFAEGNPGGPGRPRGLPNRINALLRDDILVAYRQRGGIKWLKTLKNRDFIRLLAKVLPKDMAEDRPLSVSVVVRRLSPEREKALMETMPGWIPLPAQEAALTEGDDVANPPLCLPGAAEKAESAGLE